MRYGLRPPSLPRASGAYSCSSSWQGRACRGAVRRASRRLSPCPPSPPGAGRGCGEQLQRLLVEEGPPRGIEREGLRVLCRGEWRPRVRCNRSPVEMQPRCDQHATEMRPVLQPPKALGRGTHQPQRKWWVQGGGGWGVRAGCGGDASGAVQIGPCLWQVLLPSTPARAV